MFIGRNRLLRACSVGTCSSTRVDEGRKDKSLPAKRMPSKARAAVGRGKDSLPREPGSEVLLGGRGKRRANVVNGWEKKRGEKE